MRSFPTRWREFYVRLGLIPKLELRALLVVMAYRLARCSKADVSFLNTFGTLIAKSIEQSAVSDPRSYNIVAGAVYVIADLFSSTDLRSDADQKANPYGPDLVSTIYFTGQPILNVPVLPRSTNYNFTKEEYVFLADVSNRIRL
jgi:hypothetical protein